MNETKEAQSSNVCKICGGVKDLFFEIKPLSDGAPITTHPVRSFKLCPGHPELKSDASGGVTYTLPPGSIELCPECHKARRMVSFRLDAHTSITPEFCMCKGVQ